SPETDEQWLRAERYSEEGVLREVNFSERELNAMLAKNRDLAKKLAVDMSDDLVSARLLVPLDKDFPVLGGKTLRVSAGVEMAFRDAKPVVILKGVSIMGIPIPNSWLGGLKNIDLISEFGDENGFWSGFSDGVEDVRIEEGHLKVKLKE
ncbi:MAG: arginine N-succinyltransferase, partial [Candidatus Sedimenticola sp. (ex Thyasira tokunagai)]